MAGLDKRLDLRRVYLRSIQQARVSRGKKRWEVRDAGKRLKPLTPSLASKEKAIKEMVVEPIPEILLRISVEKKPES